MMVNIFFTLKTEIWCPFFVYSTVTSYDTRLGKGVGVSGPVKMLLYFGNNLVTPNNLRYRESVVTLCSHCG